MPRGFPLSTTFAVFTRQAGDQYSSTLVMEQCFHDISHEQN
jgi:hypothetical protein